MRKNESGWLWWDDAAFLICLLLILAVICVLFAIPSKAEGPTQAQGVFCDTAEEIEAFVTLAGTGTPPQDALVQVNEASGKEHACVFGRIVFASLEEVKDLDVQEHELAIVKLAIIAVHTPRGYMPVEMTQFMAVSRKQLHPARLGI